MTSRERRLLAVYGISLQQYNRLLQEQDFRCAVCLREASSFTTNLCVDHDHKTGEIRGLLCNYCNRRLIGRHRDSVLLSRMAAYVERHTGWFVPPKKNKKKRKRKH